MKFKFIILLIGLIAGIKNSSAQTDTTTAEEKLPNWEKTVVLGISFSHTLNINPPAGTPKQAMQLTNALDLTANYVKETSKVHVINELHWLFTFGKADARSRTLTSADQLLLLHDISYAFKKKGDWNINTIVSAESALFSQYEGNYLKDYQQLGRIQAFLNPFTVTVSPGIKYQPNRDLGISLSPYSVEFYGLMDQFIADKGAFITDRRLDGHYETFRYSRLGAAANIWWKKKINKRFDVNYKYNISSNYFEKLLKNGRMNGLFITNFKIIKGLTLTHRATLKGDMAIKPFKPHYNQVVLLSYALSL
jgi:hypothetical protein